MHRALLLLGSLTALTLSVAAGADDKAGSKNSPPPAGFTVLFNGKDLAGWQGMVPLNQRAKLGDKLAEAQKTANEKILPHWTVQDGILVYDGKGNNLQTARDYGNFELLLDWRIGKGGDSGLYLRGNPQVQIWDPDSKPANGIGSGGLYNNQKGGKNPTKKVDKPIGEWNTFHIIMKGDKVTVVLNGEKVVDDVPLENYWEKGQPLPARGPIELQHHGNPLYFRNIYLKELPD